MDSLSVSMTSASIQRNFTMVTSFFISMWMTFLFLVLLLMQSKGSSIISQNFDMKDLGPADMILGMKVSRTHNGISLSLSHSIEKMLHKFDFYNSKPISTLWFFNCFEDTGEPVSQLEYSQLIGSLLYISKKTRPDISYALGRLSRYTSNLSREHWTILERVFR